MSIMCRFFDNFEKERLPLLHSFLLRADQDSMLVACQQWQLAIIEMHEMGENVERYVD